MDNNLVKIYSSAVLFDRDPRQEIADYMASKGAPLSEPALDLLLDLVADDAVHEHDVENERKLPR